LGILESSATILFDESAIIGVKMKNGDSCIGKTVDRILRTRSYCSYNIYDIVMITCKAKQQSIEKH